MMPGNICRNYSEAKLMSTFSLKIRRKGSAGDVVPAFLLARDGRTNYWTIIDAITIDGINFITLTFSFIVLTEHVLKAA